MLIEKTGRVLPFSREQVFDVAADIERYPDYLPGWISASIQSREGNTWYVEQVVGRGPVRVRFASKAVLQRPERVDITSSDRLFRRFSLSVRVVPGPSVGCSLSISAQLELRSPVLEKVLYQVLAGSIDASIVAFEGRAHRICDRGAR
jgi:coenzyme Q-binding protein COQ10